MGAPRGNCNACKSGSRGKRRSVSKNARRLLHLASGRTGTYKFYGRGKGRKVWKSARYSRLHPAYPD